MNNEVKVSVCCLVYNHEKYLREFFEGIVNQKTNFKYEVIIHDDASTDNSQEIIREYEKKYPDIIKPIYQTENRYSKHLSPARLYVYPKVKGKYIAFCEGDDYWTNQNKLQKQYDIMEKNPNCSICTHKVNFVYDDGAYMDGFYPEEKMETGVYKGFDLVQNIPNYYFHTTSYFIRFDCFKKTYLEHDDVFFTSPVGDVAMMYSAFSVGDCYYIDEVMSTYRRFSVGSWSNTQKKRSNRSDNLKRLSNFLFAYADYYKNISRESPELINTIVSNIEKTALNEEFWARILDNDYKAIKDKKYNDTIMKIGKTKKFMFRIFADFPILGKIYVNVKG